jgi:hypothetical protein
MPGPSSEAAAAANPTDTAFKAEQEKRRREEALARATRMRVLKSDSATRFPSAWG